MNGNEPGTPIFPGLEPPGPPDPLRDRVLQAAQQALDSSPATDIWTRLWQSRLLRLAWGTCVLVLIVGNVALPPRPRLAIGTETMLLARLAEDADSELAEIARLPRLLEEAMAIFGEVRNVEEEKSS